MDLRPAAEVSAGPPPRRTAVPGLVAAAALILLLAAGGYTVWWFVAATTFRDRTLGWIDLRRAEGWTIDYKEVARRGFPLRIGLEFERPAAAAPSAAWSWAAPSARLAVPVFGPGALRLEIEGDQAFEVPVAEGSRHYTASAETVAFDLVPAGWLPNGHLTIRALSVAGEDGSEAFGVSALDLTSTGDPALAVGPEAPTWAVSVEAEGVRLPQQDAAPLGSDIDRVELDAKLLGALHPDPWPASLGRWRDQGGTVEATRLDLDYGPLKLEGEGTFALDKRGQPIGAMTARIQGFEPALDQLSAAGIIPSHAAATAKILLRALARPEDEGAATLAAPLSLQDRMVSIGPVPLLRVPDVQWLPVSPSR